MNCYNIQNSRQQLKYSTVPGLTPTIPVSDDHTDGSWIPSDIYIGEFFLNIVDNTLFTRTASGIIPITSGVTSIDVTAFVNKSGDTMTGPLYVPTLSANTVSATTIYSPHFEGVFYGDGSHLTGITATIFTGGTVSGNTVFTGNVDMCAANLTVQNIDTCGGPINITSDLSVIGGITANTFSGDGSGLTNITGTNDTYVTGGTYSSGSAIFTNNSGGTFTVSGFSTASAFTGGTVTGPTNFTNGLTANTFSATTYLNLPADLWTQNDTSIYYNTGNVGIGVTNPTRKFEVVDGASLAYFNLSGTSGPAAVITTTDLTKLTRFIASDGTNSINIGIRTSGETANASVGGQGDAFIYVNASAKGLSIVNAPSTGNGDYIRLYAGILANQGTAHLHVQGSGSTKGFIGINTENPIARLHVSGNTLINGNLTATTISATTYLNLPTDIRVTGGTYTNGTATFTNNTGGTFNVTGFSTGQTLEQTLILGNSTGANDISVDEDQAIVHGLSNDLSIVFTANTASPDIKQIQIKGNSNGGYGLVGVQNTLGADTIARMQTRNMDGITGADIFLIQGDSNITMQSSDGTNATTFDIIPSTISSSISEASSANYSFFNQQVYENKLGNTIPFDGLSDGLNSYVRNWSNANQIGSSLFANNVTQNLTANIEAQYDGSHIQNILTASDGTDTTYFIQRHYEMTVAGAIGTFKGIQYLNDYSANYNNRSLVDKEYVDTAIAGGGGGTTFTGGTVTGPTNFTNGVTANTMSATTYYGDGSNLTGIAAVATEFVVNCRNQSGADMYRGQIVYISGSTGNKPTIRLAQANSETTSARTFGVLKNDIANNADGDVVTIGSITNLDTRSVATNPFTVDTLADGQTVYLSPTTAGYITNVKPSAPDHLVYVGKVIRTSPTNGYIEYQIQNGYELDELHDVQITGTTHNNSTLTYNSSTQLWTPSFIPPIGANEVFRGRTFRFDSTTVDTYAGLDTLNNASALAVLPNTTNFGNKYTRLRYYASIVSTGRVTSIRSTDLQWFIGGGFRFISTWRVADTAFGSTCQNFHGLISTTAEIAVGGASLTQVSTLTNCIFIGSDGADANLQVMHNDASGTCTKIDLGAGFPSNRTAGAVMTTMYSCELYNQVNTTNVKYRVINLETGEIAQGIITTNLPSTTQGLAIQSARVMGSPVTNSGQWEQHQWGCSDITV